MAFIRSTYKNMSGAFKVNQMRDLTGQRVSAVYSEPCQKSKMEPFVEKVNCFQPLTISRKKNHLTCLIGF